MQSIAFASVAPVQRPAVSVRRCAAAFVRCSASSSQARHAPAAGTLSLGDEKHACPAMKELFESLPPSMEAKAKCVHPQRPLKSAARIAQGGNSLCVTRSANSTPEPNQIVSPPSPLISE
eukprot:CAMPEP_0117652770 /NCGR_PEP_ID=MMETSP0804-20121206/2815_1 /TAXON_ID=1074897 /ORGANISM="Tetraselmis astigmatica, Strain CCMP880" /LENGTH=119 /DNA_ID=CAMNT_0005458861 /DNA_START=153 /DNA_END=513 /DNA_ORIENTATION=+